MQNIITHTGFWPVQTGARARTQSPATSFLPEVP